MQGFLISVVASLLIQVKEQHTRLNIIKLFGVVLFDTAIRLDLAIYPTFEIRIVFIVLRLSPAFLHA
ncbi:hypothetical protein D3C71_1927850 [compost metagenome]